MRIVGVGSRLALRDALWAGEAPRRRDLDPVRAALTDAGMSTVDNVVRGDVTDLVRANGTVVVHDDDSAVVLAAGEPGRTGAAEVDHAERGDSVTDLVTAVLRLRHRVLPGPRPWVTRRRDRRRAATVGPVTVVADSPADAGGGLAWHPDRDARLVTLSADDPAGLAARARDAGAALDAGRPVPVTHGRFTAAVVGRDTGQLREELDRAAHDLPALESTWSTPAGSYCTTRPIGPGGRVAFVYPGGFSAYPGAGGDLLRLFPSLHARFEAESAYPAQRYRLDALYPVTTQRRDALREDAVSQLAIGMNTAVLGTRLLRDVLGLRPQGALAYSFGELTALFSLGVLDFADWDVQTVADSPLWTSRLSGRRSLARDAWRCPDGDVWATHVVLAGADEVRAALRGTDRVYLTHVNAPAETVIAGDPRRCAEVLARLGSPATPSPANHVVHCPPAAAAFDELASLHDHGPRRPSPVEVFSAAPPGGSVGHTVATALVAPLDFPRLVEAAYRRGFRYFVEVGPSASCTRWIRRTLGARPHLARSVDQRGVSTDLALVRLLAGLVSHGLPVDLTRLFPPPPLVVAHQLAVAHRDVLRAGAAVADAAITRLAAARHDRIATP